MADAGLESSTLRPTAGNRLSRAIGRGLLRAMRWKIEGELPNQPKVIVIGGPHTSNWDLLLAMGTMLAVGLKFSWMMKREAFFWPLGALWRKLGGIPIDRKAKLDIVGQMKEKFDAADALWLGITPEGTRSKVERYKTGYLRLSQGIGVPLLIVGIDAPRKTVVLDRLWTPEGEIETENAAIRDYIETTYQGIRNR